MVFICYVLFLGKFRRLSAIKIYIEIYALCSRIVCLACFIILYRMLYLLAYCAYIFKVYAAARVVQCETLLIAIINSYNKILALSLSHDFAPRYFAAFLLAFILLDLQILFLCYDTISFIMIFYSSPICRRCRHYCC